MICFMVSSYFLSSKRKLGVDDSETLLNRSTWGFAYFCSSFYFMKEII